MGSSAQRKRHLIIGREIISSVCGRKQREHDVCSGWTSSPRFPFLNRAPDQYLCRHRSVRVVLAVVDRRKFGRGDSQKRIHFRARPRSDESCLDDCGDNRRAVSCLVRRPGGARYAEQYLQRAIRRNQLEQAGQDPGRRHGQRATPVLEPSALSTLARTPAAFL